MQCGKVMVYKYSILQLTMSYGLISLECLSLADFDMSDNQREHAATIVELVPNLVTLRQTCSNLSDGQFWMIYFILLLPRLNEIDMDLLSTSEARYISMFISIFYFATCMLKL